MDKQTSDKIKAFYQIPNRGLVNYAVELANLTDREKEVADLHLRRELSLAKVAEELGYTDRQISNINRDAMSKLGSCWGPQPWIDAVRMSYTAIKQ